MSRVKIRQKHVQKFLKIILAMQACYLDFRYDLRTATSRISMGRLSRELKLSASTVSRALSGHPAIAKDTAARVQAAAERYGYKPKESVQRYFKALRGEINGVAFLVDNQVQAYLARHDAFYSQILWAVERALQKEGMHMILSNTRTNLTASGSLYAIDEGLANGIIVESQDLEIIAKLSEHTSVVVMNSDPLGQNVDAVAPDIERAVRSQMDCLIAHGHRRIACFRPKPPKGLPFPHWQDRAFWREYVDYAVDLGMEVPQTWLEPIQFVAGGDIEAVSAFLDRVLSGNRATAILTYDTYAGELIRQLANRGLSVPGDIPSWASMTISTANSARSPWPRSGRTSIPWRPRPSGSCGNARRTALARRSWSRWKVT